MMTNGVPTYTSPYKEKRSKFKNPIILAVIICIGLILAVIIISLIATKTGEVISDNVKNDLKELLETHRAEVELFDKNYSTTGSSLEVSVPRPSMDKETLAENVEQLQKGLEGIKTLKEELKKYNGITIKDSKDNTTNVDEYLLSLKKSLNERYPYYEIYANLYTKIANVYINNGDGGSITELQKLSQQHNASDIYETIENIYVYKAKVYETGCNKTDSDYCDEIKEKFQDAYLESMELNAFQDAMMRISSKYKSIEAPISIIDDILSYYQNSEAEK